MYEQLTNALENAAIVANVIYLLIGVAIVAAHYAKAALLDHIDARRRRRRSRPR